MPWRYWLCHPWSNSPTYYLLPAQGSQAHVTSVFNMSHNFRRLCAAPRGHSCEFLVVAWRPVLQILTHKCHFSLPFSDLDSLFQKQISVIKTSLSWNGFSRSVASNLIKSFRCSGSQPRSSNNDTGKIIWLQLPYAGHIGQSIVNRLVRKLKRCLKEPVCFKIFHQTKKLSSFCSNKDPIPIYLKSHVIYKLTCPACNAEYIGKTDGVKMTPKCRSFLSGLFFTCLCITKPLLIL